MLRAAALEVAGVARLGPVWASGLRPGELTGGFVEPYRTPILLAAGFGATKTTWGPLAHRLRDEGFPVQSVHFNPLMPLTALYRRLSDEAFRAMDACGTDKVSLVGHSMGGLVARGAAVGALEGHARSVVTIGSPHRGAPLARLSRPFGVLAGPGAAQDMCPGSPALRELGRHPGSAATEWTAIASRTDQLVPPSSARLPTDGTLAGPVHNVVVTGVGHVGMLLVKPVLDAALAAVDDGRAG